MLLCMPPFKNTACRLYTELFKQLFDLYMAEEHREIIAALGESASRQVILRSLEPPVATVGPGQGSRGS